MKKIKINNSTRFMLLVFCIYFVVNIFNTEFATTALLNTKKMTIKILPILILVFIAMFTVNKFLKPEKIKKHLGENSNWKAWFYVSIAGILISGPPYVLFPMLKDLKKEGMNNSLIAVFLYNRNIKIPFIPVMVFYFGLPFTIIVSTYIAIFSIFNGILINFLVKE